MNSPVGFGVIGANSFVANAAVLPAIDSVPDAHLIAAASRSGEVPDAWAHAAVDSYDAVLAHPDVETVYIPLPNAMHADWTERAASAGKHVLCEKPLAPDATTARAMADVCAANGVMLAEAWMTPFDQRWQFAVGCARGHELGQLTAQRHEFTFTIGPDASQNYRWDPAQGGGALLDVGIYTVGTAVAVWGTDCDVVAVDRVLTDRGVDATTSVTLRWTHGGTARLRCSFIEPERQRAEFSGGTGRLVIEHAAFTSGGPYESELVRVDTPSADHEVTSVEVLDVTPGNPYEAMIAAYCSTIRHQGEWPRPIERSIELLHLLDRIRDFTP